MNRNLLSFRLPLLILASALCPACGDLVEPGRNKAEDIPNGFPFIWTLTDAGGRTIQAKIIGRDPQSLTIIRLSDSARFQLAFDRLSERDRKRAEQLPIKTAPKEEEGILKLRRHALEELREEIRETESEYDNAQTSLESRGHASRLIRLRATEDELLREIQELKRH